MASNSELALSLFLRDLPRQHNFRYTSSSDRILRERLFRSLVGDDPHALPLLFPHGPPQDEGVAWSLRKAQGAVEGAEYTEAARGHPCGHIFRTGESTYHCKTCAADDTCVLCARCFAESDHEGHTVFISVSPGNSGCCDCADDEAWVIPVHCSIHREQDELPSHAHGKAAEDAGLPEDLVALIRMTVGKAFDYVCDVFSCSPEQLRLPKTESSVTRDEFYSRLNAEKYGGLEELVEPTEYCLVLWNDEKHTVEDVQDQVARACKTTRKFGEQKAIEVDDVGRSVVYYSTELAQLLKMAEVIEQIKVTVTVRSSRDTFREQMCATIIDWVSDIAGCSVGSDPHVLRETVCAEMLEPWQAGSQKINAEVGGSGIHDHEYEDKVRERELQRWRLFAAIRTTPVVEGNDDIDDDDGEGEEDDEQDEDENEMVIEQVLGRGGRDMEIVAVDTMDMVEDDGTMVLNREEDLDVDMDAENEDAANEVLEATLAGYPPPPLPPARVREGPVRPRRHSADDPRPHGILSPQDSEDGDSATGRHERSRKMLMPQAKLPKTPRNTRNRRKFKTPGYWTQPSNVEMPEESLSPAEDLRQRVRLDYLILYDLRLWKTLRINLRHLYISTVVTLVEFKRVLGLRFASLYTMLSQLYLIADREPDHSIINLSVQMLTTPSITAEVVDRGNFLTNLMAILYTFLTTRQVGYPSDVDPQATLAFDAGAVTNRRMFHFFVDIRYMFQSTFVQEQMRTEPMYLLQFLDLVKLHQGVCPNVRAVGEHVEYETDMWISASMIIKEINKLCRQVAEAYMCLPTDRQGQLCLNKGTRVIALMLLLNVLGFERERFDVAEIKDEMRFHDVVFEYDHDNSAKFRVPKFEVIKEHMSFHHPLHYLFSWLLETSRYLPRDTVRSVLQFELPEMKSAGLLGGIKNIEQALTAYTQRTHEDYMCALFDHPLRVCVWLSQMRAGMWVRNGMTLRHQMHTYRSTSQRDISYQRDIFMLQAGLVLCGSPEEPIGERFLAQMLDRFDMINRMREMTSGSPRFLDVQEWDMMEEFFHLLVILVSERDDLSPNTDITDGKKRSLQRDIAHVLCFKPLSFSDISGRLTDKIADSEGFDKVLDEMTTFRAPEGLSDSGTFELRPEYIDLVDPYYAFYSRNQREEAENLHKALIAKKTGQALADIVYEPKLSPVLSGYFQDLAAFSRTTLFNRTIYQVLTLLCVAESTKAVPTSRIESLLHVILHLLLLCIVEGDRTGHDESNMSTKNRFVTRALDTSDGSGGWTLPIAVLLKRESMAQCHHRMRLIVQRLAEKCPEEFERVSRLFEKETEANLAPQVEARDLKKKQARERQARVMAQFKAQQSSFMETQGLDWDVDDYSEGEGGIAMAGITGSIPTSETIREYPSEPCMLCQEETNDGRLFGSFAYISKSRVIRYTDFGDPDYVKEVLDTPINLDQSADAIRPFGCAANNKVTTKKRSADGSMVTQEVQGLSKGFPHNHTVDGSVSTSCGHIMHFSCFETYLAATDRRHAQQIARNHPERPIQKEFLCPLCKALGNMFLPIIWKGKKESYPGVLNTNTGKVFDDWLDLKSFEMQVERIGSKSEAEQLRRREQYDEYISDKFTNSLTTSIMQLPTGPVVAPLASSTVERQRTLQSLASTMLGLTRRLSQPASETATPAALPSTPAEELFTAYRRLQASLVANNIVSKEEGGPPETLDLLHVETLCDTLAHSISAVEIAHRGIASSGTCLSSISEQSLTHLRILSETVSSYSALAGLRNGADREEFPRDELIHMMSLYIGKHIDQSVDDDVNFGMFDTDMFGYYANCSILLSDIWDDIGHHLLRMSYIMEVMKVMHVGLFLPTSKFPDLASLPLQAEKPTDKTAFSIMLRTVHTRGEEIYAAGMNNRGVDEEHSDEEHMAGQPPHSKLQSDTAGEKIQGHAARPWVSALEYSLVRKMVETYATVFLRKCLVLMHIRCGVDFSRAEATLDPTASELARLLSLLRLPTLDDIAKHFVDQTKAGQQINSLATKWMEVMIRDDEAPMVPCLTHPAIYELVGLPKTYDALTEEAIKRRCPTTGKEISDPAVCLFCGEIFCSQASCCRKENKGGCSQHLKKCGGNVGIFINIRKCMVLFLHNDHGSWAHAPYLDKHGEVDPTLRRHHQLFLNQRRYDKLFRDVWLHHGIPSAISRRLEGDINTGGWETL